MSLVIPLAVILRPENTGCRNRAENRQMDISLLTNATSPDYMSAVTQKTLLSADTDESFDSVLSSAINMLNETNDLQNDSQAAKIQFALGEADNPHDMQIAAAKAYEALQYTVAVRDKMLDAYKEIMNMQI